VEPDLTTLGKVVGGGLPVGAYGGRRELMEQVAPAGPVYQAGTLSGNPLAMAAGIAQLRELQQDPPFGRLEERGRRIVTALQEEAATVGLPISGHALGGMWGVHLAAEPVHSFEDAQRAADTALFARFFQHCLARGVYLPPSSFEAAFLSTAHGDDAIDESIERMREALRDAAA
jgi:glutamate-1-semialdehyde 2,1-aminomutase